MPITPMYNSFVDTAAVNVTTTATKLMSETDGDLKGLRGVMLQGSADFYLGGPAVTSSTGILIPAGTIANLTTFYGTNIYGITASGTSTVRVLPGIEQ